jgi:hypothetical protein
MGDSPISLDLDLFNLPSSIASFPDGPKPQPGGNPEGKGCLGHSKYTKIGYKSPVTAGSIDDDWVMWEESEGNSKNCEVSKEVAQGEKGLSPVHPGTNLGHKNREIDGEV